MQDLFSLLDNGSERDEHVIVESSNPGRRQCRSLLQRAVLKWLLENDPPAAMATAVSTRISKLRVDVAAFWTRKVSNQHREGPSRIVKPYRTMMIECYTEREECWADCGRTGDLVKELARWKTRRRQLEKEIRLREPQLLDTDVLFREFAKWRYEDTSNHDYHHVQNRIMHLEKALIEGTRFEKILTSALADQLLLAVPAGLIREDELADGWGLLWVNNDLSIELRKEPEVRKCTGDNRMHLVQNIANAATRSVLFAAGVLPPTRGKEDRVAIMVQPPRGHRQPRKFCLPQ